MRADARRRAWQTLGALAWCACLAWPAAAQLPQNSALVGRVTDEGGLPVNGVQIAVSGPRLLAAAITTETTGTGEYRVDGLPPGTYSLEVSAQGFQPLSRGEVALPAGTTYTIDFRLTVQRVRAFVDVVSARPLVDVSTSATSTNFDNQLLQTLPTRRTLDDVINLTPGVTRDVAFGGAAQTSNVIAVDGVRLMEPYLGTEGMSVAYNWVDQVQVGALGAPAEVGEFTGAIANAVLHSGANRFNGMGEYFGAIPDWTGDNTRGLNAPELLPAQTTRNAWDASGQLGGPIVKNRLWFFGGFAANGQAFRTFGYSGPEYTEELARRWILKLDAAPSRTVRLQGFYDGDRGTTTGAFLSEWAPTLEAAGDAKDRNHAWNLSTTWTPDSRTLVEVRTSGHTGESRLDPHPPASRTDPASHVDVMTGVFTGNIYAWSAATYGVSTTGASAQRLIDAAGSHVLKAGMEVEYAGTSDDEGFPAGESYSDLNGVPTQVVTWDGYREHTVSWRTTAYVQDRWSIGRVSLEPGLRFTVNRGSVPGHSGVFSTAPLGLRLGVAWDVLPSHRIVLRGHYGRYFDPTFNSIYSVQDVTGRNAMVTYEIEPSGERVEVDRSVSSSDATMDHGLHQARVDQAIVSLEHQLRGDLALEARYVHRAFRDFIGYVDLRLDDWRPVSVVDPGPDGSIGTADDASPVTVYRPYPGERSLAITNVPGAYRDYDAVQFIANRRFANAWQGQASYTWSRSTGTISNLDNSNTAFFGTSQSGLGANPNFLSPRDGVSRPNYDFSELKLLGSYDARWLGGTVLSGVYRWQNGQRWERLFYPSRPPFVPIRAEPRGTRRAPSVGTLDIRMEKKFPVHQHQTASIYLTVLNATNVGRPLALVMESGTDFGEPRKFADPRMVWAGARFTF